MSETVLVAIIAAAAGLIGALFGILGNFFTQRWQTGRAEKSALDDRRARAYGALLARSTAVMQLASSLHVVMQTRSGLREELNVTLGIQKPLDALELATLANAEMQPLFDAWSEVWLVGSEEAIAQANDLLTHCGAVMEAATQHGDAQPAWLRGFTGERWSKAQLDMWYQRLREMADSRKRFGEIARKETGLVAVDLFASNKIQTTKKPAVRKSRLPRWLRRR